MRIGIVTALCLLACVSCTIVEERTETTGPLKLADREPPGPDEVRRWVWAIGIYDGERLLIPLRSLILHLPHTRDEVVKATQDRNPRRRSNAAYVVGHFKDKEKAKAVLLPMLEDPVAGVRYQVASALLVYKVKGAVTVLVEGLFDPNPVIRALCVDRLRQFTRKFFNYNPNSQKSRRDFFAKKWQAWWRKNADSFAFPAARG